MPARYNCAPIQEMPIVIRNRAGFARWGLRPEWSKEDDLGQASKMINARSESVAEKPAFRDAWARGKRCIIPANGFYEWHKDAVNGVKQPYYIRHETDEVMCMAGLWSKVEGQVSFTVLTKAASGGIADYHHRMPVMFERDEVADWFSADVMDAVKMISAARGAQCKAHMVSPDVGKVANDYAALIEPFSGRNVQAQGRQSSLGL